jgi:ubiquinone/menaquinone biosynthesis C-methylase UbiE
MLRFKTTEDHKKFWTERKIDWNKDYLSTWNHPHRQLIVWALKSIPWYSLWEVGCGPGANLVRIVKDFPGRQLGGCDINSEAIDLARKTFVGGRFHVEGVEDILLSDDSVDVMLSDAALIYIGPNRIDKAIKELTRISRNHIILCEFHGTNIFKRWMFRFKTGYNSYNYKKLLEKHGCYNIKVIKIPKEYWDGTPWTEWGYIIIANVSK